MDSVELIKTIRADIQDVLENGQTIISAEALDKYLESLEVEADNSPDVTERKHKEEIERFKQNHERNITHYKAVHESSLEMLRTVLSTALAAIKTALLVNGAAAIAILGFLSRAWGGGIPPETSKALSVSLLIFGLGVLSSSLASAGAYFAQLYFSDEQEISGAVARIITMALVILSFIIFGFGIWQSFLAFTQNL
jgi:hypothetical protein